MSRQTGGTIRSRRALLYTPGDDMHKIQKAASLGVDCVCLDIEDGVAINRKYAARRTILEALKSLDFGDSERLVRINPVDSGFEEEDLSMVLPGYPDGIVIPKVKSGDQILQVSERLKAFEARAGLPDRSIGLIVIVETALAIVNLKEISSADLRLQALIFGAEDLAGDVGARRTPDSSEIFYARSAVVTFAAAYNLQAIDMVCIDFINLDRLRREAEQGANLGYIGKQVIHPAQVAPVQLAFTPDRKTIDEALKIKDAFTQHQLSGKGAFAIDGKMIDAPLVRAAERVLERARVAKENRENSETNS